MIPGTPEYDPVTHRNVPKYFTPLEALEILMANPVALKRRLAKTNGQRNLRLSEKCEKTNRKIAGKKMPA